MKYHISFDIEFLRHKYPGKLIAIEGNEGSGKSTQVKAVSEALNKEGYKALATKEPTDLAIGKIIREKILAGKMKVPPISLQYLYCADRAMHLEQIIDYLKKGYIIVTDRYFWSSVTYGIADLGDKGDFYLMAFAVLSPYHRFIKPDLTIYLDIDMKTAMGRIRESHKHKEIYDNERMFPRIDRGYRFLLEKFPQEFAVIDGRSSIEEVTQRIVSKIKQML